MPAKTDKKTEPITDKSELSLDQRKKELEIAIATIKKHYGEGSIMRMGQKTQTHLEVIPTGATTLDIALGVGGLPKGRIVEIFGPESSGKTTLMLHIIANAQKQGGLAAFIDVEHALDPQYAKKLGVNLDELLISQPDSGEEALTICETLVRSNSLDVVVLDSVAAIVPQAELEGDMGMATMGMQARLMSQALRKLTGLLNKTHTLCLFSNQIREKLGVMFGNPETTPGGKALKFFSSVRMDIRRKEQIKDSKGAIIGNRTRVKIVKNKVAPPYTEAEFDIMFNKGINQTGNILDAAIQLGIVVKKGAWLQFDGNLIAQGRDASVKEVSENESLQEKLKAAINEKIKENAGLDGAMSEASDGAGQSDDKSSETQTED